MRPLKNIALPLMLMIFSFISSPALTATPATEPIKLNYNMQAQKIAERAYVVTDVDYHASNVLVVKMEDGTVLIASSPFENKGTQTLLDWIQKTLEPTHIVAVNTHFHMDGSGGNEVYKKNGVEIWSSQLTKKLQLEKLQTMINSSATDYKNEDLKQRLLRTHAVPADNIFQADKGKIFNFSGETVEVYYPGPAHSQDNVVVYFPKRKLLFGGCMIKPKELGYLGDADVKSWPRSAQNLKRFDVQTVITGHGPWGGADLIDKTIDVAEKAVEKAAK